MKRTLVLCLILFAVAFVCGFEVLEWNERRSAVQFSVGVNIHELIVDESSNKVTVKYLLNNRSSSIVAYGHSAVTLLMTLDGKRFHEISETHAPKAGESSKAEGVIMSIDESPLPQLLPNCSVELIANLDGFERVDYEIDSKGDLVRLQDENPKNLLRSNAKYFVYAKILLDGGFCVVENMPTSLKFELSTSCEWRKPDSK